jgi:hypothetical protein
MSLSHVSPSWERTKSLSPDMFEDILCVGGNLSSR